MSTVEILIGEHRFAGRLERDQAPRACALFEARLPYAAELTHGRWSGEAGWIPIGGPGFSVAPDVTTSTPRPGQILLSGGDLSEPEILVPYGVSRFACVDGPLAGSHFLTIDHDLDRLAEVGRALLIRGAHAIRFARI
jgi:hypothetical protein